MAEAAGQFVLLPPRGLRSAQTARQRDFFLEAEAARRSNSPMEIRAPQDMVHNLVALGLKSAASSLAGLGLMTAAAPVAVVAAQVRSFRVIDSIHEDGAKLAELSADAINALRQVQPGIRVLPVLSYGLAKAPEQHILQQATTSSLASAASAAWTVSVVDRVTGQPIADARVVAFTDFRARLGTESRTDLAGQCRLALSSSTTVDRLYVYPRPNYWGALRRGVVAHSLQRIELEPVTLSHSDFLLEYGARLPAPSLGKGVRVGVVDSGIDTTHPDLAVAGGRNTALGEDPMNFGDNGQGHGTHVAGIIAGRTKRGGTTIGLAPEASLYSFRPFAVGQDRANSFLIAKSIEAAKEAGCDIINMSFAQPTQDDVIGDAIQEAYEAGVLLIAAAGNDGRKSVGYPAALENVAAVSAMGRRGTFPPETVESGEIDSPFGDDPDHFIAQFSNVGKELDLTAPGVGIISTFPTSTIGVMSGTSMAAPVVAGYAARLLGAHPQIMNMPRTSDRADALLQLLFATTAPLGFGALFEGRGGPK